MQSQEERNFATGLAVASQCTSDSDVESYSVEDIFLMCVGDSRFWGEFSRWECQSVLGSTPRVLPSALNGAEVLDNRPSHIDRRFYYGERR